MAEEDVTGGGPAKAAVALAGRRSGKPHNEIAVDLYGREQVDADWHAESAMRSKLRRLACRARDEVPAPGDGTRPRRPGRR